MRQLPGRFGAKRSALRKQNVCEKQRAEFEKLLQKIIGTAGLRSARRGRPNER
jgi:hypothetical protein